MPVRPLPAAADARVTDIPENPGIDEYDIIGLAELDGEPLYATQGHIRFLCDGVLRQVPNMDELKHSLKPLDLTSGYSCHPETGAGQYKRAVNNRSFTAFPGVKAISATTKEVTSGSLYVLHTRGYPSLPTQAERCLGAFDEARKMPYGSGRVGMTEQYYPISSHLALYGENLTLYYMGRRECGRFIGDKMYLDADTLEVSLIHNEVEVDVFGRMTAEGVEELPEIRTLPMRDIYELTEQEAL